MSINDKKCSEFLEMLASKAPVPGGGGAAAIGGAIGIALSNMVGNLTLGKKNMPMCRMRLKICWKGAIKSLKN